MSLLRLSLVAFVLFAFNCIASAEDAEPGKQTAQSVIIRTGSGDEVKEATIRFWLFLPKDYDEKESWPLMLFMHGAGERGDDLQLVKKWGPPRIVEGRSDFPFVVVSPQCPRNQWWDVDQMEQLVDRLSGQYKIDKSRMYCTGLSMGGYGTWGITAKYPKLFAAAVPICGGGDPKTAKQLTHLPIWAFHGDADTAVPVERSKEMIAAIKEAGGEKAKLTVYEGVGHNSWSATYDNEQVYEWLLSHRRPE